MSKNIGLVLSYVPAYSETFFKSKIKGLQKNGHKVILFVDYKPEQVDIPGIQICVAPDYSSPIKKFFNIVVSLFKSVFINPSKSMRLFQLNRRDRLGFIGNIANVIKNQVFLNHQLDWLHFGFGMLAVERENVAEAIKAKMGVSFRGYDLYLSPLKHPGCYNTLFKKTVKYHVLSEGMKSSLITYDIDPACIHVITPAIDTSFFKPDIASSTKEPLQIVTIARLHWKKGLEYTIKAMALLKDKGVDFHYTIIGEGEEKERLMFAIDQLQLTDEVSLIGKLDRDKVKQMLGNADLYLQYSIQEGFCNSVLEAQSMGLLCIVSEAEGLDENVLDKQTGWVIPKRDPELLADKIMQVLHLSSDEKHQIKLNAIKRVKENFTIEEQQKQFDLFYSE